MSSAGVETDLYRTWFDRARRDREHDWVARERERALDEYLRLGFPTTREEMWRYTSVAVLARTAFEAPGDGTSAAAARALDPITFGARWSAQLFFVNGRWAPELSTTKPVTGLHCGSLREALRSDEPLRSELFRLAPSKGHPFTALNTALFEDGAFVRLDPGCVPPDPVHLVFVSQTGPHPTASFPRTLVLSGPLSQLRLVESHVGPEGSVYWTNAVTEIHVGEGAGVEFHKLQRESEAAFHIARTAVSQERNSRFASHAITLGAALSRDDIELSLDGEGAEGMLNGLFLARGRQHQDTHTRIRHARPHGTSRELYKGIVEDQARGVFHGDVIVDAGAQKTDAIQTNKNLLLSREALVNSTPALQILADDVRCKHGSTTGQLDERALFYLRSRGLDARQARSLLVYAFASEIVERIGITALRVGLEHYLHTRLPAVSDVEDGVNERRMHVVPAP